MIDTIISLILGLIFGIIICFLKDIFEKPKEILTKEEQIEEWHNKWSREMIKSERRRKNII